MTKTKDQFIDQMNNKVFKAWWSENEILFPLVHTSSARKIFIAGREKMEDQFMKQKKLQQKTEMKLRKMQSKFDRNKNESR